jgi:hypothetical protein
MHLAALAARAQPPGTADDDGKTHFYLMPYLVLAGMGGDITIQGRTASLSTSAGDVLSNLQFGFMGRMRVTHNRWFVALDGIYMGLGAANSGVDVGVDQTIVEPDVGFHVTRFLEAIAGARYNHLDIDVRGAGGSASRTQNWWDPLVGGRVIVPLGRKLAASARLDFGGFSAGSRLAINSEPTLNLKISGRGTLLFGWKFLYTDFHDNNTQFRYNVLTHGPLLGAAFRW